MVECVRAGSMLKESEQGSWRVHLKFPQCFKQPKLMKKKKIEFVLLTSVNAPPKAVVWLAGRSVAINQQGLQVQIRAVFS